MLEVCIDSLESANNAIIGGADEIEICSALYAGGFTPSIELVQSVLELVEAVPVGTRPKLNALIRINTAETFIYSDQDMVQMLTDMWILKELGINGFVFGALTEASEVDETKCIEFLNAAAPNRVTFSRAFDYTVECKKSAAIIAALGFYRLLTSGHRPHLSLEGASENINYLTNHYSHGQDRLVIMPGGGVTPKNVKSYINMGVKIVHSSCRSTVPIQIIDNNCVYITDADLVRELKEAIG